MRHSDGFEFEKPFFRAAERYFQADGKWYFAAREGDQGPYQSRAMAEREACEFIESKFLQAHSALEHGSTRSRAATGRTQIPLYRHVLGLSVEEPRFEELVLLLDD